MGFTNYVIVLPSGLYRSPQPRCLGGQGESGKGKGHGTRAGSGPAALYAGARAIRLAAQNEWTPPQGLRPGDGDPITPSLRVCAGWSQVVPGTFPDDTAQDMAGATIQPAVLPNGP